MRGQNPRSEPAARLWRRAHGRQGRHRCHHPEGIPREYYERITYAYADRANIDEYVNGKADEPGQAGDDIEVAGVGEKDPGRDRQGAALLTPISRNASRHLISARGARDRPPACGREALAGCARAHVRARIGVRRQAAAAALTPWQVHARGQRPRRVRNPPRSPIRVACGLRRGRRSALPTSIAKLRISAFMALPLTMICADSVKLPAGILRRSARSFCRPPMGILTRENHMPFVITHDITKFRARALIASAARIAAAGARCRSCACAFRDLDVAEESDAPFPFVRSIAVIKPRRGTA